MESMRKDLRQQIENLYNKYKLENLSNDSLYYKIFEEIKGYEFLNRKSLNTIVEEEYMIFQYLIGCEAHKTEPII